MTDLRRAAELALEALIEDVMVEVEPNVWEDKSIVAIQALRQALGTEQEPVGYVTDSGKSAYILLGVDLEDDTPLYTAPPQKEEGCAQCGKQASQGWALYCVECVGGKEWLGLSDEEIQAERHKVDPTAGWAYEHFARAIEAKLKEKNT